MVMQGRGGVNACNGKSESTDRSIVRSAGPIATHEHGHTWGFSVSDETPLSRKVGRLGVNDLWRCYHFDI
ncbi:hypothetical protein SeLEV6574_g02326 [Synchytrium endobioticum]|uniref:Uncharacterized protein n=1 Tax=Synchytrium endobioticum TaxID=286115 RepID=A0A507D8Z8_9FUNG|nr:hypothetical protein SeLEV6574_g02326 [Synchytrium endobioticum]